MDVQLPDGTTVQGVPDGTSKADLAQKLKANGRDVPDSWLAPAKAETAKPSTVGFSEAPASNIVGAVAEPLLSMGTGMAGKFAGDIAGMGAIPAHAMGMTQKMPQDVQRGVRESMTYQPRTAAGASEFNPLNAIPSFLAKLIGGGAEYAGTGTEKLGGKMGVSPAVMGPARSGIEEAIQQLPNVLGAKGGAMAAERLPGKQAALDVAKGESGAIDAIRDAAQAAGYKTPPESGVKAALSGLAGKSRAEKALSPENAENAARRLGKEVGLQEGEPLSPTVFEKRKQAEYDKYNALSSAVGKEVKVTDRFRQKIDDILATVEENKDVTPELKGASELTEGFKRRISPPEEKSAPGMQRPSLATTLEKTAQEQPGPRISRTLEKVAGESPGMPGYGKAPGPAPFSPFTAAPSPALNTKWVMNQISDLRKRAKDDYRLGKTDVANARYTIANELELMIEENLGKKGAGMLAEFKEARKNLAKIHLLEDVTDSAGRVNLQELGALAEKPRYKGVLDGEFKTAADFANTWRKAAAKPTGEAIPRFSVLDGLLAASSIGATAMGHAWGPALAGELALRAGVPFAAQRGLLQNRTPPYAPGAIARGAPTGLPIFGAAISGQMPPPQ